MTGLVRKAMLFGVFGLLAGSAALANVPDCGMSTVPSFIYVVGLLGGANPPDTEGGNGPPFPPFLLSGSNNSNVIIIKDAFGSPIANVGVHIKFPCDINLCTAQPFGTVTCDATGNTLHGTTDLAGRFEFVAIGANKDPGAVAPYFPIAPPYPVFGGGGFQSTIVTVDGAPAQCVPFKLITSVNLDQDGAGGGSNGTTGLDISKQFHNVATFVAAGASGTANPQYRGRADQNADSNITALDLSFMVGHFLRLAGPGSVGCLAGYCTKNPCP
jgi:hypothetical protein